MQHRGGTVSHDRPVDGNLLDELDDVTPTDVTDDAAWTPCGQHDVAEHVALLLPARLAHSPDLKIEKRTNVLVEGIGATVCFELPSFSPHTLLVRARINTSR